MLFIYLSVQFVISEILMCYWLWRTKCSSWNHCQSLVRESYRVPKQSWVCLTIVVQQTLFIVFIDITFVWTHPCSGFWQNHDLVSLAASRSTPPRSPILIPEHEQQPSPSPSPTSTRRDSDFATLAGCTSNPHLVEIFRNHCFDFSFNFPLGSHSWVSFGCI